MALLYGLVAVALIWGLVNSFAYANTAALAKGGRVIGGVLALVIAVLRGVRGGLTSPSRWQAWEPGFSDGGA
jgi:hypothetical protein